MELENGGVLIQIYYLIMRVFLSKTACVVAQDRERQHVRGEAQPLYGMLQDTEAIDSVSQGAGSVRMSDMGSCSGVVSTVTLVQLSYFSGTLQFEC
jgi:hypothetical protein